MAECPGTGSLQGCTCPDSYRWAEEMYREVAARQALRQIRAEVEAGTVSLAAAGTSIGVIIADNAEATRALIRREMGADVRELEHVRRVQAQAADPTCNWDARDLAILLPPALVARADRTEQVMLAVGLGIESAAVPLRRERFIALSASPRTRAAQRPARHPGTLLSDPGVRQHLGLHGTRRREFAAADGHGHNTPGQPPEAPEDALRAAQEAPGRSRRRSRAHRPGRRR